MKKVERFKQYLKRINISDFKHTEEGIELINLLIRVNETTGSVSMLNKQTKEQYDEPFAIEYLLDLDSDTSKEFLGKIGLAFLEANSNILEDIKDELRQDINNNNNK